MPIPNLMPPCNAACPCGATRFRNTIFTGCFCYSCQHNTGSSSRLRLQIEDFNIELLTGSPSPIKSELIIESGRRQTVWRWARCLDGDWSSFGQPQLKFIKAGVLKPDVLRCMKPGVFVWTKRKATWIVLDPSIPAYEEFYEMIATLAAGQSEEAGSDNAKIAAYWKDNEIPEGYGVSEAMESTMIHGKTRYGRPNFQGTQMDSTARACALMRAAILL